MNKTRSIKIKNIFLRTEVEILIYKIIIGELATQAFQMPRVVNNINLILIPKHTEN